MSSKQGLFHETMPAALIALMVVSLLLSLQLGCGGAAPQETTKQAAKGESATTGGKTYKITLAGASPGGLWSLIGEGVSAAMAKQFPGSTVTYETTGGGYANIPMLARGEVELGIAQSGQIKAALEGWPPFDKPTKDMYALAFLYDWEVRHIIIRKEVADKYGINSLDDIAAKKVPLRIAVNQKGNLDASVNEDLLALYGMPFKDIENWGGQILYVASKDAAALMKDRRSDMNMISLFERHSSILEIGQSVEIKLLPVKDSVREELGKKWGAGKWTIKAGTYEWQKNDIDTVSMAAVLLVNKNLPDDTVYDITKALVENISSIQAVHSAMKALTPEMMAKEKVIPYHPGAVKYYKEKGLM